MRKAYMVFFMIMTIVNILAFVYMILAYEHYQKDVNKRINETTSQIRTSDTQLKQAIANSLKSITTIKGDQGENGAPGLDGKNGKDGADGNTPVIDYGAINSMIDKKIPQPKDGTDGKNGRTPVFMNDADGNVLWKYSDDTLWSILIEKCSLTNTCEE